MSFFKFKIKEYFLLQGEQIGITGDMYPDDFPIVTKKFHLKLVSKNRTLHIFENIGEEIPSRNELSIRTRAFRTSDNIKKILDSEFIDDLYIVGSTDE